MNGNASHAIEIPALLIAPDRDLAQKFLGSIAETHGFQILADLRSYPPHQTVEIRARQLKPAVALLDLSSDSAIAIDLIRFLSAMTPPVHVVGLHTSNDGHLLIQSLRAGAVEFLHAPFETGSQREALERLRKLCVVESTEPTEAGRAIAFTSSKPGSGASTVATQTAFSLQRTTGKRVLLADLDLTGGTIGFYLKLSHNYSLLDALQHVGHLDAALWNSLTVNFGGIDILPAPAAPYAEEVDASRLRTLIEHARRLYSYVVLDLPAVFHRSSLMAISECDVAYMVSTTELPSLHLTRKALNMIDQLGFPKDRFQVLMNRVDTKRDEISVDQMEKLFNVKVHASLPNDYFSLHRVVTLGQPLGPEGELGKSIEGLAQRLSGVQNQKKTAPAAR